MGKNGRRAVAPSSASPLRAALAAKKNLRTHFDLAIEDTATIEAAQRRLDVTRQMAAGVLLQDDEAVTQRAEEVHAAARAALEACFHRIYFRGLQEPEFDALVEMHPPTDEQAKDHWIWNPDTFNYALLEACVVDGDLTAAEWEAELASDRWPAPDKRQVIAMCLAANRQTMADAVPKG